MVIIGSSGISAITIMIGLVKILRDLCKIVHEQTESSPAYAVAKVDNARSSDNILYFYIPLAIACSIPLSSAKERRRP